MAARPRRVLLPILMLMAGIPMSGVLAQGAGVTYNTSGLPLTRGTVVRYGLSPSGDVDGLILSDNTEVHFPPSMGSSVADAVRLGDRVRIYGPRSQDHRLVQAMSIADDTRDRSVSNWGG